MRGYEKLPRESCRALSHGSRHKRPAGCVVSSLFIFLVTVLAMLCYAVFLFITLDIETPPQSVEALVARTPSTTAATTETTDTSTSTGATTSTATSSTTTSSTTTSETTPAASPTTATDYSTTRKARPPRRPMGKRPLFCTFGTYEQEYERIDIDGVCDFAFMPFYSGRVGDTLLDDSHPVVRKMLRLAVSARSTAYAVSIPQRQCLRASEDLGSIRGQQKMEEYWTIWHVYHYGVLDLEVRPDAKLPHQRSLRAEQHRLKEDYPTSASPERGFVVLGFRLWPQNMAPFLRHVTEELSTFMVDGVIPLTHISRDEFAARYPGCWVTGAAPYDVPPDRKEFHMLGMKKTMEVIGNQTEWNAYPSLAVSVTMCTRLYMIKSSRDLYAPCLDHQQPPNTMSAFCQDPLNVYVNRTMDEKQFTMISRPEGSDFLLATFESSTTISTKICLIMRENRDLDVGLALFDIDCEDWSRRCDSRLNADHSPTFDIRGNSRFDQSTDYFFRAAARVRRAGPMPCP
ncbi:uncharacterized protein [Dermacentor albipictus]|uniref:uncharacterized protein isoform X2 n=1 Tax=Dermacentor albipictus TaxID=60249 RepID=UPI0031FC7EF6